MNSKLAVLIASPLVLAFTGAGAHGSKVISARVVSVEPVYQTVIVERPVTACHREYVERRVRSRNVGGQALAGAIVGAAIGRQFGDGRGRDALTMLGAVAGSAVAQDRALRRNPGRVTIVNEPVERCSTHYRRQAERQLTGYWVDYSYRGRLYRVLRHERPGNRIRVQVSS
jgi:uncharacterized protein YcfJ